MTHPTSLKGRWRNRLWLGVAQLLRLSTVPEVSGRGCDWRPSACLEAFTKIYFTVTVKLAASPRSPPAPLPSSLFPSRTHMLETSAPVRPLFPSAVRGGG